VQRYAFTYLKSPSTERSLLKTITRCDGGNACLWSKEFDWETTYRPNFFDPIELGPAEYDAAFFVDQTDSGIQVLDTDGDGRDEILYRIDPGYFIRRMDGSGSGSGSGTPLGERILIDPVASAPAPNKMGFQDVLLYQSRAIDSDGDGAVELWAAQPAIEGYHIFGFDPLTGQPASADKVLPAGWARSGIPSRRSGGRLFIIRTNGPTLRRRRRARSRSGASGTGCPWCASIGLGRARRWGNTAR
jgi:hypothetical protein